MSPSDLVAAVPVVQVSDLAAARDFWCETLGFTLAFDMGDYCGVQRGAVEVHLDATQPAGVGSVSVRLHAPDVDAVHAAIDPAAVDPAEPLETKPWGTRQFSVRDADGNRVTFFAHVGA